MPLITSAWSGLLLTQFSGIEFSGPKLPDFCNAIASGSTQHLIGRKFDTIDAGLTIGAGPSPGTGIGVIGIVSSIVSAKIYDTAKSAFGQAGPKLMDTCDVIASVLVTQMSLATLTSTHTPVFLGSGTVTPGSINVDGGAWGSAIQNAAPDFQGSMWPAFANAIGVGCAEGFKTATGQVVIAGSWSGLPVPSPVPGAGSGSGNIS
jgi:hypothetical protein